ncbi:MAG TPA: trypsin-like peptidase domain-containing protein [Methylomirabilota bacterium]|jgi:serine protease Do
MRVARPWILGIVASLALASPVGAQPAAAPPGPLWREGPGVSPEPELLRLNTALTRLAEQLKPALVQIRVQRPSEEPDPEEGPRRALGSGFLIHPSGYVVTNAHVVERSSTVQVRLASGRRLAGTVVGRDRRVDLALVKVEAAEAFPVLPLGDSERLAVGELVLALGHPFGLEQTVSLGIVSRKGAPLQAAAPGFDFIQTDAAVNPGNSGGPLVDMGGQVVGVNTMAARNGSIGFAIPINLIKTLLPQLLAKGSVEWGWLGVRIDEITEDNVGDYGLETPRGVGIEGVLPGQPAAQAGLRAKDVILEVDGHAIATPRELQRVISTTPVGTPVRVSLWRDGQAQELTVTVGRFPEEDAPARPPR